MSLWDDIKNIVGGAVGGVEHAVGIGNAPTQAPPQQAPQFKIQPIAQAPQVNPDQQAAMADAAQQSYNQKNKLSNVPAPQLKTSAQGNPTTLKQVWNSPLANAVVKAPVQAAETLGKGLYYAPEAVGKEIQNKSISNVQQKAFGTTNPKQIAQKIGGSTLMLGSYLVPGGEILGETAPVAAKVATGVGIYGGANAASTAAFGGTKKQILQSGLIGGLGGGGGQILHEIGKAGKQAIPPVLADEGKNVSGGGETLYRGQPSEFTNRQSVQNVNPENNILVGKGVFTTTNPDVARSYGENVSTFEKPTDSSKVLDLSNASQSDMNRLGIDPQTQQVYRDTLNRPQYKGLEGTKVTYDGQRYTITRLVNSQGELKYELQSGNYGEKPVYISKEDAEKTFPAQVNKSNVKDAEDILSNAIIEKHLGGLGVEEASNNPGSYTGGKLADAKDATNRTLQKAGYDFVKHTGGIRTGDTEHDVYIALHDHALQPIEVGKNVNPSPAEAGVPPKTPLTPKNIKAGDLQAGRGSERLANKPNLNKGAFSPEDQKYLQSLNAEQKAELEPKQQMELAKLENKVPSTKLAPADVNTARNAYKAPIPEVEAGDYKQIISNEQTASNPVLTAGDRWEASMKKLQKTNPDEYKSFWKNVEQSSTKVSPELKDAISKWRVAADRAHGTSQALGGNTNYITNYALHPWDLPEGYGDHLVNGGNPDKFQGLNNLSRIHQTIAEGEKAGLKLGQDPIKEGGNFIKASASLLKRRAIVKGVAEADRAAEDKTRLLDMGGGHSVPISEDAYKQLRGLQKNLPSTNKLIRGARTTNTLLKSSILSLGQFHPINISLLRATPTLLLRGHPINAAKGLYGTFRTLLPGGKDYAENVLSQATKDGIDVKAAKIGMPYGSNAYETEGAAKIAGIGHTVVFGKQMPMMHDAVARSIISDLEKKNIDLDSAEARTAGKAGNNLMGFVNKEAQNIPPKVNRALGDFLLAKQFTHSKFSQDLTAATKLGVGGSYARANVVANVAAASAIIVGLGYAMKQKSDDLKDMLLRALIHPAVPTPLKDSKGNTINLRLPATDTADLASLLGISLVRQPNGHLGVNWKPQNMPTGISYFMQARLSPFLSQGIDIKTNKTFAGYPMYNTAPNTSADTKVAQGAYSALTGVLPIGLQGLPETKAVSQHLPQSIQQIQRQQKPGTNPFLKSIGSSFGLTPSTDQTVGKGLATAQYYNMRDSIVQGAPAPVQGILNDYFSRMMNNQGQKVSEGTVGGYLNAKIFTANTPASQQALQRLYQGEHNLPNNDPLWKLPLTAPRGQASVTAYLTYQSQYEGPEKTGTKQGLQSASNPWIDNLANQRSAYFSKLPPSIGAAAKEPAYPNFSSQTNADLTAAYKISNSSQYDTFIGSHPDVVDAQAAITGWQNQIRLLEGAPTTIYQAAQASPQLEQVINTYNALPPSKSSGLPSSNPKARSEWIKANPNLYNQMISFYANQDMASTLKDAIEATYSGQYGNSQPLLKAVKNTGSDIVKNPNGTYALNAPAASAAAYSSSSSSSPSFTYYKMDLSQPHNLQLRTKKARYVKYRLANNYNKIGKIKTQVYKPGTKAGKLPIAS